MIKRVVTRSPAETEALGEAFGAGMEKPHVIWLYGDLGAGKTVFTRGLARGLGCDGQVSSPTYTLVREYSGRLPLFHFDLYRLDGLDELLELGWDDYLSRGGVCAVEWAGRLEELPDKGIIVTIEPMDDSESRCVTIDTPDP